MGEMSYEVYVDVRHHPRHLDDWEQRESNCGKYTWKDGEDPMPLVAACLRELADRLSPESDLEADERRVWVAVNNEIQAIRAELASAPATQRLVLGSLMRLADNLGLDENFLPGVRAGLTK